MAVQRLSPEVAEVLGFASELGRAIQFYKLYPETHPFVKEGGEKAIQKLSELLGKKEKVVLGVSEGKFFVEDEQIQSPPIACKEMIGVFSRLSLSSMILRRGVDEGELRSFIKEVVALDKKALSGEKVDAEAELSHFPHIERNIFTYKRVTTKEEEVLDKVKETAEVTGRDEVDVVRMLGSATEVDFEKLGADMLLEMMEEDSEKFSSVVLDALKKVEVEGGELTPAEKDPEGFAEEVIKGLRRSGIAGAEAVAVELEESSDEFASDFVDGLKVVEEETGVDAKSLLGQVPERFCSEMAGVLEKSERWRGFTELLKSEPRRMGEILEECFSRVEKKATKRMLDVAETGLGRFAYGMVEVLEEVGTEDAKVIADRVKRSPSEFSRSVFEGLKKVQEVKGLSFEEAIERKDEVFWVGRAALVSIGADPGLVSRNRDVIVNGLREELGRMRGRGEVELRVKTAAQKVLRRVASVMVNRKGSGVEELEEVFVKLLSKLPPQVTRALFGSSVTSVGQKEVSEVVNKLSRRLRTRAMMNEFLKEYSEVELPSLLRKVVQFSEEIGDIAGVIANELKNIPSEQKREEMLTRFIRSMKGGVPVRGEPRYRAVVVDADDEAVAVYKRVLLDSDFGVLAVRSGEEAVAAIKEKRPDLVVLDVKLPGRLSGIDVLRSVRAQKVPVVLATRHLAFKNDFEFESYPKKEFLAKPVSEEGVKGAIKKFFPKESKAETVVWAVGREELSEAEKIQKSLLPKQLPQIKGFHLAVAYAPCLGVSGDYYDIVGLGGNKYGVLLCDVSGKGVSAAMVMVLVRTLFRTVAGWHDSPRAALIHLNTLLSKEMTEGLFVSGVYAVIDSEARTVTVANAGHCPPVLWSVERGIVEVKKLSLSGMVMGLVDAKLFESKMVEARVEFQPGMGLLLYSDGVTEAMNENKVEFGEENLVEVVKASGGYEPERMIANVYGALEMFRGRAAQSDDTTVVCVKCTG